MEGRGIALESPAVGEPEFKKPKLNPPAPITDLRSKSIPKLACEDESDEDDDIMSVDEPVRKEDYLVWKPRFLTDPRFLPIVEKFNILIRTTGWRGFFLPLLDFEDAYGHLEINRDPRGFQIVCDFYGSGDSEMDSQYLQLLHKIVECDQVQLLTKNWAENLWYAENLASDFPLLRKEEMMECLRDYYVIYEDGPKVKNWQDIRDILLRSDSKDKCLKDPEDFKRVLEENFLFIGLFIDDALRAVVPYWVSESMKDKERAERFFSAWIERSKEHREERLKHCYTQADYLKLKLEVASKVGIVGSLPEDIANLCLPGHYKWPEEERASCGRAF